MDNNLTALCKKSSELSNLMYQFASKIQGTYEITPNNYFLPTGATFSPVEGGVEFKLKL